MAADPTTFERGARVVVVPTSDDPDVTKHAGRQGSVLQVLEGIWSNRGAPPPATLYMVQLDAVPLMLLSAERATFWQFDLQPVAAA